MVDTFPVFYAPVMSEAIEEAMVEEGKIVSDNSGGQQSGPLTVTDK